MAHDFSYDVFLSYNSKDKLRVRRLAERLKAAGLRVWFDEWNIRSGDNISLKLDEGLEQSRVLLLCLSPNALGSGWVTLERITAIHRDPSNDGRRFIPLLLADAELPFTIQRYKYVDFREETEEAFLEILEACRPPEPPTSEEARPSKGSKRFRVAISFAGEKRVFVGAVANILAGVFGHAAILYDEFHKAEFARADLGSYLPKLYIEQSELLVQVISTDFDTERWSGLEWLHFLDLPKQRGSHEVLFGRFGSGEAPWLYTDAGFIQLDDKTPEQFATLILERLALNEGLPKNHYVLVKPVEPQKKRKEKNAQRKANTQTTNFAAHDLVTGPAGFHPEFRSVGLDGNVVDYLEVESEAVRLAELIALRETNLPLAVGLFGNWGSGKSHFMGLLRMHMLNRANTARREQGTGHTRWCKEIVPIVFNAWHYLDSNLWASLVSEIFERLFERLQPKGDALQRVQERLQEVGGAIARAQEEVALSQAAVTKATSEFQVAQQEAEQAQTAYAGMVDQFKELLPEFKEPVSPERIAELLGVEPELATLSALKKKNEELSSLVGQIKEIWRRMKAPRGRAYRIGVLLVAGCLGPLLLWLAWTIIPGLEVWLKAAGPWVKYVLQCLAAMLAAVTPFFAKLQLRLHDMRGLQQQAEDAQKEKEKTPRVIEAKEQLETAKAVAIHSELQLAETKARQKQIQKEADELAPGRRVSRFIEDRARSADYRGQLGLVSLARRDFEELSNLFANQTELEKRIDKLREEADALEKSGNEPDQVEAKRKREEAEGLPKLHDSVDRIVLFVDDLDRCQPEKVVDVLQAVHLLLAFPLFAVIVGVDQRCLRTSLKEQFKGLLAESEKTNGNEQSTTPLDYLEKIFHVPFHLPGMDAEGFGNLIWKLSEPRLAEETSVEKTGDTTIVVPEPAQASDHIDVQPQSEPILSPIGTASAKTSTRLVGSVPLHDWERTALQGYHPLIRTPRGATRLLNTYRLVRAGLKAEDWEQFRPNRNRPGEAAVAMLLLAVAAGHPSVAREWFAALRRAGGNTWVIPQTDEIRHRPGWAELETALDKIAKLAGATEKDTNARLKKWLPLLPKSIGKSEPLLFAWLPRIERFAF